MTCSRVARRTFIAAVASLPALLSEPQRGWAGIIENLFVPKADLWPRWTAHEPQSQLRVDHTAWDKLLKTYIRPQPTGINRVAYGEVTAADRNALEDYLGRLSTAEVSRLDRPEQLAFWVNLYNSLTVRIILTHYPVVSIQDISDSPGFFDVGPWGKKIAIVEREWLSLNDIEHRILRPIWRDPRVHYGINCASIGCPNLQHDAFTGENVNQLLDLGARQYVNHPRGVAIVDGKLIVSSIYVWFRADFGGTDRAVIAHLRHFAKPVLADRLADMVEISSNQYDWRLNDMSRKA